MVAVATGFRLLLMPTITAAAAPHTAAAPVSASTVRPDTLTFGDCPR
jgi:hypothetical protein